MATEIYLRKGDLTKESVVGFSWTTLFFGCFVPLFRGDWVWFFIMLILAFLSFGLAFVILAFVYNKIYTGKLLENGWVPADEYSYNILCEKGMMRK